MNRTITITAIVLVAVVMGMSAIAPAMAFEAEPDSHAETACDALFNAIANGGSVSIKALERVCDG